MKTEDLSGPWYGRYEGGAEVNGNSFIALVEDAGGTLSGSVSEPDDLGIAAIRHARIAGRRSGQAVTFVKQYDGAVLAHAVTYMGVLNEAGTLLSGTWSFARYSGTFMMEREIFTEEELEDEEVLDPPARQRW